MQIDWWTIFWGGLLIAYGISLLFKAFLGISIPVLKPVIGIFLIYLGIVIITGLQPKCSGTEDSSCYTIFFGQQTIDLSKKASSTCPQRYDINVAFGNALVKLPNTPVKISARSAFSKIEFPDKSELTFGSETKTFGQSSDDGFLDIRARAQFGNLEFITVDQPEV